MINNTGHTEQHLLIRALHALKVHAGVEGKILSAEPDWAQDATTDAQVELEAAGTRHRYSIEIKRIDRFAALTIVRNQFAHQDQPGLLIAPRVTPEVAKQCRELGLQFIDTVGNAYLNAPGLYVYVTGLKPAANAANDLGEAVDTARRGTATGLRVIFVLLCYPDLLNAPYRDINDAAGVALGTIGWVFNDLKARAQLHVGNNKAKRRLVDRDRLIQEWATNYPIKLRPKLNTRRFHAPDPDWWRNTDLRQFGAQWGGEVAADKLTRYLKPEALTIYMFPENAQGNLNRLVAQTRLRRDPNGEIEILDAFWKLRDDDKLGDTVPPLLVYADLMATTDPRHHETARMILKKDLLDATATP